MEQCQNIVNIVIHSEVSISGHPGLKKMIMHEEKLTSPSLTMSKEEEAAVEVETLACSTAIAFLLGCDRARYGKLIEDLKNDFLQGRNKYPMTVVAATTLSPTGSRKIASDGVRRLPMEWLSPTSMMRRRLQPSSTVSPATNVD